tara:strand:- start:6283 stop:6600 length:318 start_codon:yes stop_codon:yes gene_type:complete
MGERLVSLQNIFNEQKIPKRLTVTYKIVGGLTDAKIVPLPKSASSHHDLLRTLQAIEKFSQAESCKPYVNTTSHLKSPDDQVIMTPLIEKYLLPVQSANSIAPEL